MKELCLEFLSHIVSNCKVFFLHQGIIQEVINFILPKKLMIFLFTILFLHILVFTAKTPSCMEDSNLD